jgi:hypothetical protein
LLIVAITLWIVAASLTLYADDMVLRVVGVVALLGIPTPVSSLPELRDALTEPTDRLVQPILTPTGPLAARPRVAEIVNDVS